MYTIANENIYLILMYNFYLFSDDSLRYEYPFTLKLVHRDGTWCSRCPWHRLCRGCPLPCNAEHFQSASSTLAVDWDQTALHLRYLSAKERVSDDGLNNWLIYY